MTITNRTHLQVTLALAYMAASEAQQGMTEDRNALDCGFAWVTIPGTDPLARYCRSQKKLHPNDTRYGDKHWHKGWMFWCPGDFRGQAISIHKAGAKAFSDFLNTKGIPARFDARLD